MRIHCRWNMKEAPHADQSISKFLINLVAQKNKGNVFDSVSETQSSLLVGGSCSKVNCSFKTFFNFQLVFSVPVLNAPWIICRLEDPISIS